jgi:hypothetical protein
MLTLTLCTKSDYDNWKFGKLIFDSRNSIFVKGIPKDRDENEFLTYDEFWSIASTVNFVRELNDVIAFGYYEI